MVPVESELLDFAPGVPRHAGVVVRFEHPENGQNAKRVSGSRASGRSRSCRRPAIWLGIVVEDSLSAGIWLTRA